MKKPKSFSQFSFLVLPLKNILQSIQKYPTKYHRIFYFTRLMKYIVVIHPVTKTFFLLFMYKLKQIGPSEASHKSKILTYIKIIFNNKVPSNGTAEELKCTEVTYTWHCALDKRPSVSLQYLNTHRQNHPSCTVRYQYAILTILCIFSP